MAAFDDSPYSRMMMAAAIRQPIQNTAPQGGGTPNISTSGVDLSKDTIGQSGQQSSNPISPQTANNLMKYFKGLQGGGATAAAGESAMPAMAAGGGSDLGSMGLMQGSVNFPGAASAAGGSGGSAAGGMSGALGSAGGIAGLAALAYLGDKEMNESENSIISTDNLNSLSYKGIGLRGGDLVNGFNPATWLSDPKKAAKGLANAFTFGIADKIF